MIAAAFRVTNDLSPFASHSSCPSQTGRLLSLKPNTHRRRRRDATVESSLVGIGRSVGLLDISFILEQEIIQSSNNRQH